MSATGAFDSSAASLRSLRCLSFLGAQLDSGASASSATGDRYVRECWYAVKCGAAMRGKDETPALLRGKPFKPRRETVNDELPERGGKARLEHHILVAPPLPPPRVSRKRA